MILAKVNFFKFTEANKFTLQTQTPEKWYLSKYNITTQETVYTHMTTLSQSNSRSFISLINVLCYYCQNIASILQFISFFNHHVVIYCTRIIDAIPCIDNVGISFKKFSLDIFHPPVYYNPLLITF